MADASPIIKEVLLDATPAEVFAYLTESARYALADLAAARGCYGTWVGVDASDNAAAVATYRSAGAEEPEPALVFNWTFR